MSGRDITTKVRAYRPAPGRDPGEVACVEVVHGQSQGRVIPLALGTTLIGRAPSAAVRLDEDGVSRHHAKIVIGEDGAATLLDLASTNGTFLNDAKVERAVLRPGDRIQIGPDAALRFAYHRQGGLGGSEGTSVLPALSSRELEVAQMVAEGLSNADIGQRLFISPRTVGTHLRNVYERLEIHSRAELTRLLAEHGLLRR